jgi:hypothetical protein
MLNRNDRSCWMAALLGGLIVICGFQTAGLAYQTERIRAWESMISVTPINFVAGHSTSSSSDSVLIKTTGLWFILDGMADLGTCSPMAVTSMKFFNTPIYTPSAFIAKLETGGAVITDGPIYPDHHVVFNIMIFGGKKTVVLVDDLDLCTAEASQ